MIALTVMYVLFVCEVNMLRECEGDDSAGMGPREVWLW